MDTSRVRTIIPNGAPWRKDRASRRRKGAVDPGASALRARAHGPDCEYHLNYHEEGAAGSAPGAYLSATILLTIVSPAASNRTK